MTTLSLTQAPFGKKFAPLFVAGMAGVLALIPTITSVLEQQLSRLPTAPPLPVPALVAASLIQPTILLAGSVAIGAALAPRLGLRSHIVEKTVAHKPLLPALRSELPIAAIIGAIGFAVILVLDLAFRPLLGTAADAFSQGQQSPTIRGVLMALLYGGITEELLLRWGIMTLFVWLGWRVAQRGDGLPRPAIVWSAIILAAVLFGLGHLPATAALVPLTLAVTARAVLLNGILGVAFGWLYWRHSLEASMMAHAAFHVCSTTVALARVLI